MIALAAPSDAAASVSSTQAGWFLSRNADHVAALDAAFLQCTGKPADPVVPLGPRPGSVQIVDGLLIGLGCGPVGDSFVEKARLSQVRHDPSVPWRQAAPRAFRPNPAGYVSSAVGSCAVKAAAVVDAGDDAADHEPDGVHRQAMRSSCVDAAVEVAQRPRAEEDLVHAVRTSPATRRTGEPPPAEWWRRWTGSSVKPRKVF